MQDGSLKSAFNVWVGVWVRDNSIGFQPKEYQRSRRPVFIAMEGACISRSPLRATSPGYFATVLPSPRSRGTWDWDRYTPWGYLNGRDKAATQRSLVLSGLDPIEVREGENRKRALEAAKAITFTQCAASYIESHRARWRNEKHGDQWESTIKTYCEPVIGSLPVQDVDTGLVLKILEPIWSSKPETASRLRGRIENIIDWAKARGYRSGENPARWKGHINQLLPALAKKSRVIHHKALPFPQVGELLSRLREMPGVASRCLEFTILTAARTSEATGAKPEEFDLTNSTWTIPASRMKAKKEHRVPLSPRALEIVREMLELEGDYLFMGAKQGKPISNMAMLQLLDRMKVDVTTHGFRSSFRDWGQSGRPAPPPTG